MRDESGPKVTPDGKAGSPARRKHGPRRATSGQTGGAAQEPPVPPGTGMIDGRAANRSAADRSADDTDAGWGEPPTDDDEHLLRDVPPHW